MKLAVIADIHANLEALQAVMAHLDAEKPDETVCLGDVIGYGASPAQCVEILMKRKIPTIHGNHERMLLDLTKSEVRKETAEAISYTLETLGADQLKWIQAMPTLLLHRSEFLLVHGSPRDPDEYCNSAEKYSANLKKMRATYGGIEFCFFGHTHFPLVASRDGIEETIHEHRTIRLRPREVYLINPGSVGQPRDGCWKASYGIYDSEASEMRFYRLEYDVETAKKRIKDAGLSSKLAARLTYGK